MSSSPSTPATPDYTGAANATAQGNLAAQQAATQANRVNTYTPYGSLTYSQDPNNPNSWTSNVNLSSTGQQLLDQQNKTSLSLGQLQDSATSRVGDAMNSALPSTYDPTQATNNASQLIMDRLAPQQKIDQDSLNNQLANQGITAGSEAYTNAQAALGRTQNDAKQQAQLQGITLGQQQQAQTYAQQTANRNIPINDLNALRTGSQVTNPTFGSSSQQGAASGADYSGATTAAGNYAQGLYGSQTATANANNATTAGLASMAAMAFMY